MGHSVSIELAYGVRLPDELVESPSFMKYMEEIQWGEQPFEGIVIRTYGHSDGDHTYIACAETIGGNKTWYEPLDHFGAAPLNGVPRALPAQQAALYDFCNRFGIECRMAVYVGFSYFA